MSIFNAKQKCTFRVRFCIFDSVNRISDKGTFFHILNANKLILTFSYQLRIKNTQKKLLIASLACTRKKLTQKNRYHFSCYCQARSDDRAINLQLIL